MKNFMKRKWMGIAAVIVLIAGIFIFTTPSNGKDQNPTKEEVKASPPTDRVLGEADAPVTIIEYASFTCGHCADFHTDTFPKIKENFINSGQVKFIFRDFPLDRTALLMSVATQCAPEDKYYQAVSDFMQNQRKIMEQENPTAWIYQYAAVNGYELESFKKCLDDESLLKSIAQGRIEASQKYDISSTPSFIINGVKISGAQSYARFESVINEILNAEKKDKQTDQ